MITILKNIIASIISPSMTIYYGRDDFNNFHDDTATFPICYIDPLTWTYSPTRSGWKPKTYEVRLFFANKSELDYLYGNPDNLTADNLHSKIFAETDAYVDTFLNKLEASDYIDNFVEDVTNIRADHAINIFNLNVSGTVLTFNCRINQQASIC